MLKPDGNQACPATTSAAIEAIWQTVRIEHRVISGTETARLLNALRKTHVNGGAEFANFSVGESPSLDWFISRNDWAGIQFPEHFLQSPVVRAALPEVCKHPVSDSIGFESHSPFTMAGELAQTLSAGGAYFKHEAGAGDAFELADTFRKSLFGGKFDEVLVLKSFKPWSAWFYDIAWDATWLIIDKRQRLVSVLAVTDTD